MTLLMLVLASLFSGCTAPPPEGAAAPEQNDPLPPGTLSPPPPPPEWNECFEGDSAPMPVTDIPTAGGSWFQIYQEPQALGGEVKVSWHMYTAVFAPQNWSFNIRIWDNQDQVVAFHAADTREGRCVDVGSAPENFFFLTEAGFGAWNLPTDCSVRPFAAPEMRGEIGFTLLSGDGEPISDHPWGMKPRCSGDSGPYYNSVPVFRGQAQASRTAFA